MTFRRSTLVITIALIGITLFIFGTLNNVKESYVPTFMIYNDEYLEFDPTPRDVCSCSSRKHQKCQIENKEEQSTCSNEATCLGLGQKVISFSVFIKNLENKKTLKHYTQGIQGNLKAAKEIYPNYVVRLYTNIPLNTKISKDENTCDWICIYDNLYWCDINNIPVLGNLSDVFGMFWRFLPMGDPTVSISLSRDSDSLLSKRERAAVAEWENSAEMFHTMRDHTGHKYEVMGGMWGVKNDKFEMLQNLRKELIQIGRKDHNRNSDQLALRKILFLPRPDDFMVHDSYYCTRESLQPTGKKSLPFPTKKEGNRFVGGRFWAEPKRKIPKCPVECRPSYGKDWEYC